MVVDAPELPPLLFNRNGKYTYVCSYENVWDSEKHISVRVKGKTRTVGKIIGGELTGTIEWTEDFINQYPILKNWYQVLIQLNRTPGAAIRNLYFP